MYHTLNNLCIWAITEVDRSSTLVDGGLAMRLRRAIDSGFSHHYISGQL